MSVLYKMGESESEKVKGPAAYITNARLATLLHNYISGRSSGMRILDDPMMYMCNYPCKQKQP